MGRKVRLLCFGTVLKPMHYQDNLAANPASSKWLSGFLDGLIDVETNVSLCGHCYAQAWPKGPLFPGRKDYLDFRYDNHLVRFCNIPGIRFYSMGRSYYQAAKRLIQTSKCDAVATYNPYPWHAYAARRLRQEAGIPWISLNLDFDDVGVDWVDFERQAGDADGHLFLSHWGYENAPVERKIHLDSGVSSLARNFGPRMSSQAFNIVYLGKLSKAGGLDALLALPKAIPDVDVRFIYGGKGSPSVVRKLTALASDDARVDFRGFVGDDQVEDLFNSADVFINPRDPDDVVNDMVFPSKIMHYLQMGKTIVSTWTKGLDPVYRELMLISETPKIEDFVRATRQAVHESHQVRLERSQRIKDFLKGSRLWPYQAERFRDFVELICSLPREDDTQ